MAATATTPFRFRTILAKSVGVRAQAASTIGHCYQRQMIRSEVRRKGPAANSGPYTFANLTNSSAQAVGVQNSLRWIQSHIGSYGDCDGWLSGNNDVINTLLGQSNVQTDSVDVGRFSDPFVNAVYGTAGTDLPTDGTALLTVNLNGAYFNSSVSVGAGVSGINGGSDRAKLFILLHELAHATEAAEFQSGDSTPDVQAQNNSLLLQKCGDFIKSVSN